MRYTDRAVVLSPVDAQRHLATSHREPLRERLRQRARPSERDHRGARGARSRDDARARHRPPEARRGHGAQLDFPARACTSPVSAVTDERRRRTMANAIARDFGSVNRWRQEFVALADGLAGGSGWVLLTYVPRDGRLINHVAMGSRSEPRRRFTDPGAGHVRACLSPRVRSQRHSLYRGIHAQHRLERRQTRYRNATKVAPPPRLEQKQFPDLPSIAVEEVKAMLDAGKPVQIIDTRPRHYTTRAQDMMEGATWRDPGAGGRMDRRTVEDRSCRHVLRLRIPRRLRDRRDAAQGRLRRPLHGWRALCLEGDQGSGEAARVIAAHHRTTRRHAMRFAPAVIIAATLSSAAPAFAAVPTGTRLIRRWVDPVRRCPAMCIATDSRAPICT